MAQPLKRPDRGVDRFSSDESLLATGGHAVHRFHALALDALQT